MRIPESRPTYATTSGRIGPGMIVAGALTLSAAVFFGYTLPKFINKPDPPQTAEAETGQSDPEPAPEQTAPPAQQTHPTTPDREKQSGPPLASITPPALRPATEATRTVAELARALRTRPSADATATLEPESTAGQEELELLQQIFRDAGFELDPDHPPRQVGEIDGRTRWEFPVVTSADGAAVATSRITIDLVKGADGRWRIAAVTVPDALKDHLASLAPGLSDPAASPAATAGATATSPAQDSPAVTLTDPPTTAGDPLSLADAFVQALAAGDFATARALTDPAQLSDEKLAALFIVTEDGKFAPREHRPIVTITYDEDTAMLVVRLGSSGSPDAPATASNTEFGLELEKDTSGKWKVAGVNFSQLIADTAASLGAGDVAYAPIVDNPSGGESLALYFPFDDAGVHHRASRQLNIIASILKSDPDKRIKIDGHADARGTYRYNDRLSRERAINVRAALLSLGTPNDQIIMRVYGEAKPAAPNTLPDGSDNPPGRARNRRTEIYLDF